MVIALLGYLFEINALSSESSAPAALKARTEAHAGEDHPVVYRHEWVRP
jgi:hypothetical protein